MSVSLYVSMMKLGSHWTHFHEIRNVGNFRKLVEKIQVSLKPDKNKGYFTWRPLFIFYHVSLISYYNEKSFRKKREKIKTRILCSITFFFKSCRLWENVEKSSRARQAKDGDTAHEHCMLDNWRYRHSLRKWNTYCSSSATKVTRMRLMLSLCVHCLSFYTALYTKMLLWDAYSGNEQTS